MIIVITGFHPSIYRTFAMEGSQWLAGIDVSMVVVEKLMVEEVQGDM